MSSAAQDAAECLLTAVGNPKLIHYIKTAPKTATGPLLIKLLQSIKENFTVDGVRELPEPVAEACGRVVTASNCLLTLLGEINHPESVQALLQGKLPPLSLEATIRGTIQNTESLNDLLNEFLQTATTNLEMLPMVEKDLATLQEKDDDDSVFDAASKVVKYRSSCRPGAKPLVALDALVMTRLKNRALALLDGEGGDISSVGFDRLVTALTDHNSRQATSFRHKLVTWRAEQVMVFSVNDMMSFMKRSLNPADGPSGPRHFMELAVHLNRCATAALTPELLNALSLSVIPQLEAVVEMLDGILVDSGRGIGIGEAVQNAKDVAELIKTLGGTMRMAGSALDASSKGMVSNTLDQVNAGLGVAAAYTHFLSDVTPISHDAHREAALDGLSKKVLEFEFEKKGATTELETVNLPLRAKLDGKLEQIRAAAKRLLAKEVGKIQIESTECVVKSMEEVIKYMGDALTWDKGLEGPETSLSDVQAAFDKHLAAVKGKQVKLLADKLAKASIVFSWCLVVCVSCLITTAPTRARSHVPPCCHYHPVYCTHAITHSPRPGRMSE
jgi:hypothetical protein